MSNARYQLLITEGQHGQRLDRALTALVQAHAPLSRARVQALLKESAVTLKGKVVSDAAREAQSGEVYELTIPPARDEAVIEARELPLEIVYEDADILVLNKPAGLVVHPAAGHHEDTLVNALLWHKADELSGIGGVKRPGIVHRLDKDTSGLMVVAKHDEAHHKLSAQFADRSLSRTYVALVWGVPVPRKGRIEAAIGRSPTNRQKMAVTKNGKPAATRYTVEQTFANDALALVRCELETGRTHQIRVHLTHIGHPLVGDPVYGGGVRRKAKVELGDFKRQALHAAELKLIHPRSRQAMQFSCALPADLVDLLAQFAAAEKTGKPRR
jgi:23S rRNA pseudouridine1911/1915/1917 synthase